MKKRTNLKALLAIFAFLLTAGTAIAWFDDVEIMPPNPTSHDIVYITLSGYWNNSCVPYDSEISFSGSDIYFDAIADYPPDIYCAQIMTDWQLTESVGPLPVGTYTVYACLNPDYFPSYEQVAEFTVTATTYYVDAVDGNDNNDGLSPETAFKIIQKGIDEALDGDTVIVLPGLYEERIDFLGKNITLRSIDPADMDVIAATVIAWGVQFLGTEDANCTLTGFKINGGIHGGENHTQASISYCWLSGRYCCTSAIDQCDGEITNCLIGRNYGACIELCWPSPVINGCHGLIKNCTIANHTFGVWVLDGGTATIENCIIYSNVFYQLGVGSGGTLNISYCDVQGGLEGIWGDGIVNWGPGNIDEDPFFDDVYSFDYHLKSQAGRWNQNGWVGWVIDGNTSACIDAGNPGCPLGDEPNDENNARINMGAYGGTAQASKSPANWRSIADLTNDWAVDFSDLAVFVNYWLDSGQCLPSDLNRNQFVNFTDFAIFSKHSSGGYVVEPGIIYEISLCGFGLLEMAESGQTRFTATVDGSYIHFEDVMVANCCADELWLDMEVTGNLITIYEHEEVFIPCLCICDSPVTAALGPFEPGIYTLEVYEDFGGFIGSTIVIIQ